MSKRFPIINMSSGKSIRRIIRTRKEDSAFVYAVLESHEGICSYSTLGHRVGDAYRDLELSIPIGFAREVDEVLKELGDLLYELEDEVGSEPRRGRDR